MSKTWTYLLSLHKHFFATYSANVYNTTVDDKIDILEPLNINDLLDEKNLYYIIYDKIPNILFTHDFITSKIAEFNIASNFCTKCDPLLNHFYQRP